MGINISFMKNLFGQNTDTPYVDAKQIDDEESKRSSGSKSLYHRYGYDDIHEHLIVSQELLKRFADYEAMDDDPIIASSFDLYADDVTQVNYKMHRTIWCEASEREVSDAVNGLLHNTLQVENVIWEQSRTLAKYGNNFELLRYTNEGIVGQDFISPALVRRFEAKDRTVFGITSDGSIPAGLTDYKAVELVEAGKRHFEDVLLVDYWEMLHNRLRTKNRGSRYGYGIAENARWAWKRLSLLEDATLLYKLSRSPNRYVYYVHTGNRSPKEAEEYLKEMQKKYRKQKFINPKSGKLEFKNHPLSTQEDIWIGVRDGKDPSRIEPMPSVDYQSMDELEFFKNKLHAGLKIPKRFLTYGEGADSRVASSNEDIRFARSVLRLQREMISGYGKIVAVDMAIKGIDHTTKDYTLKMTVPSTAFEIAQIEVENTRAALAAQLEPFVSRKWILTRILGMSDSDADLIIKAKQKEMQTDLETQNAALNGGGQVSESKEDKFLKSKEWARIEQRLDKRLEEVKESAAINNSKFRELKGLLFQLRDAAHGLRTRTHSDGYLIDGERTESDRFFTKR